MLFKANTKPVKINTEREVFTMNTDKIYAEHIANEYSAKKESKAKLCHDKKAEKRMCGYFFPSYNRRIARTYWYFHCITIYICNNGYGKINAK